MTAITISSAATAFTAAMALITVSAAVFSSAWKNLRLMVSSLPEGRRKVRLLDLRTVQDEREKDKAAIIMVQFWGCMFFVASMALSIFAIMGVASVMLGYNLGFYQQQNYQFGNDCLFAGVIFFTLGFIGLGFAYIEKIRAIVTGEPDISTTPLKDLSLLPADVIARRRRRGKLIMILISVWLVIIFVIQAINPFGTWINILVAVIAQVIIWLLTIATIRIRNKIRR